MVTGSLHIHTHIHTYIYLIVLPRHLYSVQTVRAVALLILKELTNENIVFTKKNSITIRKRNTFTRTTDL